ncbi:uncharacterized protein METZ01_LOCUS76 [marine metagenome]|uniref:Glycosyltransferase subfamily 4-like N-terminal domain-containing protein n=1 Tax=marine metagenome TaxID=408172 RepID=A0A381MY02_9ZZZZ
MQKTEKILIITYYWPPAGGSGVQRWMYFSKYLSQFNFQPIILSVNPTYASYSSIDKSLENGVSNIESYKTFSLEPLKFYSLFKSNKGIPQSIIPKKTIFDNFLAFIRLNFFIPDARIGWNPFALKKALKIVRDQKIKYIITTGPPHSTHLIGLKVKNITGVKWLADFRDPWQEIFYLKNFFRFNYIKKLDLRLEKKVLSSANAIITTVGEKYHNILKNKILVNQNLFSIYNGYDKKEFDKVKSTRPDYFNIVFTGVLSENNNYEIFLKAIKTLDPIKNNLNIKFNLAGNIDNHIIDLFSKFVSTKSAGYLSHNQAISFMKSSHLLVNFNYKGTNKPDMISGKLIEYLASGSPIVNISHLNSESEFLISLSEDSVTASEHDIDKIVGYISKSYNTWLKGEFKEKIPNNIYEYSRLNLTKRLANILREI